MIRAEFILRYAIFAAVASFANLASQRLVLGLVQGNQGYVAAVCAGTGVGLVLKYVLDKRWMFGDRSEGIANHSRKFTLYTLMGGATTLIFWGTETAFWMAWRTDLMREVGAVLGLVVGYIVKYDLDRRFVFDVRSAGPG